MNNKSSAFNSIEFIALLKKDPIRAFNVFIEHNNYFNTEVWSEFRKINIPELEKKHPASTNCLEKFIVLQYFAYLHIELAKAIRVQLEEIKRLNPSKELLLKCLYLSLELADQNNKWPTYSNESVRAIKKILSQAKLKEQGKSKTNPSKDLFNTALFLLRFTIDQALVSEFLDIFLWADFEFRKDTSGHLLFPESKSRESNLYINNLIKTEIKKAFLKKESQSLISKQEHFLKNDLKWKTNEGVVEVMTNKNVKVTSTKPGTTSLQVDDEIFEKLHSDDPAIRNEGTMWLLWHQAEQGFHLNLRDGLSEVYIPNDVVDIHYTLKKPFSPKFDITIYDFFCITSALISNGKLYHNLSKHPLQNIASIKSVLFESIMKENPSLSEDEIWKQCDSNLALNFSGYEKHLNLPPVLVFDKNDMLAMFRKVEELKEKTDEELITILDFLANPNSSLPFTPIYKLGDNYHFSYVTCLFNFNRVIYDSFISKELFNNNNKSPDKQKIIGDDQNNRSKLFHESLKNDLLKIATKARSFDRPENTGDFDVLAYFKEGNALLAIQVKLSNTSPMTERRKAEWIEKHIHRKGIEQIEKDLRFLSSPIGLAFAVKELGLKKPPPNGLEIYQLIVTDNFYCDHLSLPLSIDKRKVMVISYFELRNLIDNKQVDDRQGSWVIDKKSPAKSIISNIEKNAFWKFIIPIVKQVKLEKSLTTLPEEYQVHLRI